MKKYLCLLVLALFVFALSGCGGSSSSSSLGNDTTITNPDTQTQDDDTQTDDETQDDTPSTDEEEATSGEYSATGSGEHAISLPSGKATYSNITVNKTGDASGSSDGTGGYDWTGSNAAILASGGAVLTITGSSTKITTDAVGGNAVFSYGGNNSNSSNNQGDGTTVNISDATITTSKRNSGGIMTTGGGIMNASNLTITTSGQSSAAIRSDSGGGIVTVSEGTYTTNGTGSPAIYSTANITVADADLTANASQVVIIEGKNSVTLNNCTLDAHNTELSTQNDSTYQAILIYQSMSGDSSTGTSAFKMTDGSVTNEKGDIFCVTNTACTIDLSNVAITNNDSSGNFLRAEHQNWGSNGGTITLNASGQDMSGNIIIDSSSSLTMNLKDSSNYSGAINTSGQTGTVNVTIEDGSTWTLTGNSYVTSLTKNGTIETGNYTLYVNGSTYTN